MKLNRNGQPRKPGSGRPKGSGSFASVELKALCSQLPESAQVIVSRKWAETLGLVGSKIVQFKPAEHQGAVQPAQTEAAPPIQLEEIDLENL